MRFFKKINRNDTPVAGLAKNEKRGLELPKSGMKGDITNNLTKSFKKS